MQKWALLALFSVSSITLSAATLVLRDGTVIRGEFIGGTRHEITFQNERGVRRQFNLELVRNIDFSRMDAPPAAEPPANAYRSDPGYRGDHYWAVIPAGTELAVRTDQNINSHEAVEGRFYPATIHRDVLDASGNVVIPRGSPAQLVIRRVEEGGALNSGYLVLDLDSVQVNGHWRHIDTSDIRAHDRSGLGANQRTGEMVGGGAALGTLLGAVAGGGKGAAIGALAGAVAGGGVEVATKGKEIRVPAETLLRFRLDRPMHLREQ